MKNLKLGTRGSQLALRQAEIVKQALESRNNSLSIEIVPLVSQGDLKQGTILAERGDKKDWIAGLEEAILEGAVDFTVNCAKDVPLDILKGTALAPILIRANSSDAIVLQGEKIGSIDEIPNGARVGTASLRRQAQLNAIRPDIKCENIRGNITTRIEKLRADSGLYGIVLAVAGLERIGVLSELSYLEISPDILLPPVNQGILAAQYDERRHDIRDLLLHTTNEETYVEFAAEREVIRTIGADCRSAVGVLAEAKKGKLFLRSIVLSLDGKRAVSAEAAGTYEEAPKLGRAVGKELLSKGAEELL